ncbi:MAG: hypothetical protein JRJ86_22760 [Deltaproteobacteria bacterium]|nr:hypothetical protein [Deltaproteobacteria bacterium]
MGPMITDNTETMSAHRKGINLLAKRKTGNMAEVMTTALINLIAVKTSIMSSKKYAGEINTE